eukprot:726033-Rhodomonas_salina.1
MRGWKGAGAAYQVELALKARLDHVHMQQAQETTPAAEQESARASTSERAREREGGMRGDGARAERRTAE